MENNEQKNTGAAGASGANTTAPKKEDSGEEMVQVPKSTLDRVLSTLDRQEQKIADLEAAADIGRMANIQAKRNAGKLVHTVKLTVIDKKVVIGWKLTKDEVYFEGEKLVENQEITVFLEDKTKKVLKLRDFTRNTERVEAEVLKRSTDQDGETEFVVALDDGREVTINTKYVN